MVLWPTKRVYETAAWIRYRLAEKLYKVVLSVQGLQSLLLLSATQSCLTLCNSIEAAHQPALSFTIPQSLLKLMFIKSLMPSSHLILCHPLLLLPPIFPIIRFFSKESALCIRWPKYWSFSFSISPSNEYSGLISFRLTGLISSLSKGLSRVFSSTTVQKHQLFSVQPSLWTNSHMHT